MAMTPDEYDLLVLSCRNETFGCEELGEFVSVKLDVAGGHYDLPYRNQTEIEMTSNATITQISCVCISL